MGKRCGYCGATESDVRLAYQDAADRYICETCHERLKEIENEIRNNSEPTCDYSVCFYLVDGSMFETTIYNQTEDFKEFVNTVFRHPYAVIFEDDKEACCINLHNVTRFMIRKKEKEE